MQEAIWHPTRWWSGRDTLCAPRAQLFVEILALELDATVVANVAWKAIAQSVVTLSIPG